MPKKDNLLRAVSRKRQKAICLQIPAPNNRHFDVPNEFAPFLLQDSGKDDKERILIFGDATMKNLLNLSNTYSLIQETLSLVRSEVHLDYGLANPLEKCSKPVTRNQGPFKFVVLVRC